MDFDFAIRELLVSIFPDLRDDPNFKILSDRSDVYNCIAWAMWFDDRWVDIYTDIPGHWWPENTDRGTSPEALIHAFEAVGFILTDDDRPEEGYHKVVLYKKKDTEEWTHAARIVTDTTEHSKFGPMWDGTHSHNVLCNTGAGWEDQSYGVAFACMKRPDSYKDTYRQLSGTITVDTALLKKFKSRK